MKSFHAGATHVWLPYADEQTALRYIDRKNITHVVVRSADAGTVPYIEKWIRSGVPHPRAEAIYAYDLGPDNHVKIYEIGR
jgi:hypothetical protein